MFSVKARQHRHHDGRSNQIGEAPKLLGERSLENRHGDCRLYVVTAGHKCAGLECLPAGMFVIRVVNGSPFLPCCVISKKTRRQLLPSEALRPTSDLCRGYRPSGQALDGATGLVPGPHRLAMDMCRVPHQRPCFELRQEALKYRVVDITW